MHSVKSLPCLEALERNATRFQELLLRAGIRFGSAICILARPKQCTRCCAPRPTSSIGLEVALWSTDRADAAAAVAPTSSTTTLAAETLRPLIINFMARGPRDESKYTLVNYYGASCFAMQNRIFRIDNIKKAKAKRFELLAF